jgi:hypothetical protein
MISRTVTLESDGMGVASHGASATPVLTYGLSSEAASSEHVAVEETSAFGKYALWSAHTLSSGGGVGGPVAGHVALAKYETPRAKQDDDDDDAGPTVTAGALQFVLLNRAKLPVPK